jgi:hypothetical protein
MRADSVSIDRRDPLVAMAVEDIAERSAEARSEWCMLYTWHAPTWR